MKALLKRMLRPFYRASRKVMRPIADRLRGPLSRLLYPPEFETVFRNLEQITNNLKSYVDQSDQMLLAMFRTLHLPPATSVSPPVGPVSLGNGRVLTKHPCGGVFFADADDLRDTPRILLGDFEPHVTEALRRLVRPGDCCVDLGAGIGFHTLNLAQAAGLQSRSFGVELDLTRAALLRDNITANNLNGSCEAFANANGASPGEALRWLLSHLTPLAKRPDVVRIRVGFDCSAFRETLAGWAVSGTRFVLSTRSGRQTFDLFPSQSLWRVAADGSLFRTTRDELESLGETGETHFVAANALQ